MLADLVFIDQNPIANLKVLYGTGWIHVNDTSGAVERVGGIKYVMKDGILYDAKKLLRDVAELDDVRRHPLGGDRHPSPTRYGMSPRWKK